MRGNDLLWVIRNFCHSNFCHSNFCLIPFFSPRHSNTHSSFVESPSTAARSFFLLSASLLRAPDTFHSLFLEIVLHCEKSFTAYISWRFIAISDRFRKKKKDCRFSICCSKGTKKTFLGGILHFRDQRRLWCKNCAMIQKRFRFYKTLMTIVHFSYFALR